jgi:RNA polymerase sigma-70 factor (ECF subfamily)
MEGYLERFADLPTEDLQNWNSQRGFKKIYDYYAPLVWRLVFRTLGNEIDAKIVLQSVFVVVYKSIKNFRYESAFSTWIYRITLNETIKFINKRKSRRELPLNENIEVKSSFDGISDRYLAKKILESLSAQERFLLVSREVDGISFDELAEITGKTSGALRVEISRLKQKIRENFNE